jgi:hypothetical protein
MRDKFLAPSPHYDLAGEFDRQICTTFTEAPVARFVGELRHYSVHNRLPIVRGHIHMDMVEDTFDSKIALAAKDLLARRKWPAPVRQFIEESGDLMPISDVVVQYCLSVDSFEAWFRAAFEERNREKIDEFHAPARGGRTAVEGTNRRFWRSFCHLTGASGPANAVLTNGLQRGGTGRNGEDLPTCRNPC